MHRYFVVYKPYLMLSQFIGPTDAPKLGDLSFSFPEGTHAIGRLDFHSEGLLLLTTNKRITKLLFQGSTPHKRVYWAQGIYTMTEETIQQLQAGVSIRVAGGVDWVTSPCEARLLPMPINLPERANPLPEVVPYSWVEITLTEGKFHQVRKMMTAVRHKCKRLVRVAIEDIRIDGMQAGEVRELSEDEFFTQLKLGPVQY